MRIATIVVLLLLFGCTYDVETMPAELDGAWVEISAKTDTLVFNIEGTNWMELKRGKEIRDGFLLPKAGAGIFEYRLGTEKISLYNLVSSCYCFADYYFKREGSTIYIENFYDPNAKEAIQTFKRL